MHPFKVILWDIDGTLLNFHMAEAAAIRALFQKFNLGICTDEMLKDYSGINATFWKLLEAGKMTKPQILTGRFETFFQKYNLDTSCVTAFNDAYQLALGDTICFNPGALETITAIKGNLLQCAVTNGTLIAQKKKLALSGLDKLFDGIFISDVIGAEKPHPDFFDAVWKEIGHYPPEEVLIVGDSLTSDIRGGNNIGIRTCWYNPSGNPAPDDIHIDFEISEISQVLDIIH